MARIFTPAAQRRQFLGESEVAALIAIDVLEPHLCIVLFLIRCSYNSIGEQGKRHIALNNSCIRHPV